jgi:hypothetical protein
VGAVVATGGRMVVQAQSDDGVRLSFWHNGVRTELTTPTGWSVNRVIELTDRGLLIANLSDAVGTIRPAAWNLAGR